jgi:hypothetical protein
VICTSPVKIGSGRAGGNADDEADAEAAVHETERPPIRVQMQGGRRSGD